MWRGQIVHKLAKPGSNQVEGRRAKSPRSSSRLANGIGSSSQVPAEISTRWSYQKTSNLWCVQSPTLEAQWAQEDAKEPQTINIEQLAAESRETKKFTRVPYTVPGTLLKRQRNQNLYFNRERFTHVV